MAVPLREWVYKGYVPIERFTPEGTVETRLPFVIRVPVDQFPGPEGHYQRAQYIQQTARQIAKEFISMLEDTAPAHRADYGDIGRPFVDVISLTPSPDLF